MLKSNALEIIRSFTKEEIAEFNDFLRSPYFNKKTGTLKLFNEIVKCAPNFTDNRLESEKLWAKLYPRKEFNYGVMKNLIHDLTRLAEQFITQQEYRIRVLQDYENLYSALSKRKLKNILDSKKLFLKKKYNDDKLQDSDLTPNELFSNLTKIYQIQIWDQVFHDQQQNLKDELLLMKDTFITGMIIQMINVHSLAEVSSYNDKGENNNSHLMEIILKSLDNDIFKNGLEELELRSEFKYKLIKSYFLAYKANFNADSSEHYYRFKNFVLKNYQNMPYHYLKDMDTYLLNSISFLKDQTVDKKREYYELYLFRHKNKLIVERNNQLNSHQFIPWLFLFLDEDKLIDMQEYISGYKKYLTDEDKDASIMFAEAVTLFSKSEFSKALSVLTKIKFKLSTLKIMLRKFTLMTYYELDDYEGFIFSFDSFKHFLNYGNWNKREWNEHHIYKTKIFTGIIDKLFKLREMSDIKEIELYEKELTIINIDNKKWFLRKIQELKSAIGG